MLLFWSFVIVMALLLVGYCFLPLTTSMELGGLAAIVAGCIMLVGAPISGLSFMAVGAGLIVAGRKWQTRIDQQEAEEAEAAAEKWSKTTAPRIPLNEDPNNPGRRADS